MVYKRCRNCNKRFYQSVYESGLIFCNDCYIEALMGGEQDLEEINQPERERSASIIQRWYRRKHGDQLRYFTMRRLNNLPQNRFGRRRILILELDQLNKWIHDLRNNIPIPHFNPEVPIRIVIERMDRRREEILTMLYGQDYNLRQTLRELNEFNSLPDISFNDIQNSETDPMVIESGIKNIYLDNKQIPFDIYKYKDKNKEVRNHWVVYWNKEKNAIGLKYVYPQGRRWYREGVTPDFRKRNIFYLDIIDNEPNEDILRDYNLKIRYDRDNRLNVKEKLFTRDELNDDDLRDKNYLEINWNTPTGRYNPEYE